MIGPINLSDDKAILIEVVNKKTNVNLNELSQIESYEKIQDFYIEYEASKLRKKFVKNLMSGKQIDFRDDALKILQIIITMMN